MTRTRTALALAAVLVGLAALAGAVLAGSSAGGPGGEAGGGSGSGPAGEQASGPAVTGESAGVAPAGVAPAGVAPAGVAVVELFTSQGCSSCPPADRLLSELAADPALAGRVLPLAFHVDYWNYIGWRDPFSSERFSDRQRRYARALDASVYTPQAVINGRTETVGSRRREMRERVDEALASAPAAEVTLSLEPGSRVVAATVAVRRRPSAAGGPGELWLALYQDDLTTPVTRGENADRRLENDRVVRRLQRALELAEGAAEGSAEVELAIEPGWDRDDLGVVAFLQDPESLEILGAAGERLGS